MLEQELESRLAEQWGRRLQLREEELRAEIREKDDQLQLAAETEQLQREAAAAGQQNSQLQDREITVRERSGSGRRAGSRQRAARGCYVQDSYR